MLKFTKRGFTLIELMVVIGIIAILSAAGFVALSGTRPKARDARRRTDILAIANAMELFYSNQTPTNAYPAAGWAAGAIVNIGTVAVPNNFVVPTDPINTGTSVYTITSAATNFCACALLEAGSGGNASSNACAAANNGAYFCNQSRQ